MKPLHLLGQSRADGAQVCRWFGASALRPEGELVLPRAAGAERATLPESFLIDLAPLRAEVVAGRIDGAPALAAAPEFLALREWLAPEGWQRLAEAIYLFLWRLAQNRPLETHRRRDPGAAAWADPDRRLLRVWFATDRQPTADGDPAQPFSDQASAPTLSYGQCSVFIPKSHRPGSTGTAWWRRWIRLEADDHLALRRTRIVPGELFWSELAQTLSDWWSPGERNVFVLIHGFNVGFAEAAIRAAQIGYDLKLPGEIAFYSWPSRGAVEDYAADEATITASVGRIATFLEELSHTAGAERIHLFVHSMGNRGFLSALERLAALHRPALRLGQVFFCAPDEDVRTFGDKTQAFPFQAENRTLLVSPEDKAVAASRWLHQHERVGIVPPVHQFAGIETVSVSGFGLLDLGHGYFASAEQVILDMREAIATQKKAGERQQPKPFDDHYRIYVD